jgi:hypothetical protein
LADTDLTRARGTDIAASTAVLGVGEQMCFATIGGIDVAIGIIGIAKSCTGLRDTDGRLIGARWTDLATGSAIFGIII